MDPTQTPTLNVAVVRGDNRRGALAEALALITDDLRRRVTPDVLVKPNLVSHRRQLPSTHAETLSATLDALLASGAGRVVVAEGASDASAGFERFGYRRECFDRPVTFLDLNRDENDWEPLMLAGVDGSINVARLSRTVSGATCRVSLALAKTHVTSMVTLSLKNMLSSIHPADRVMMHGHARGGNGYKGWKRPVVEFLKGDHALVNVLTRLMGRVRNAQHLLRSIAGRRGFEGITPSEYAFLRSVDAMNWNLVALSRRAGPHVSVVDGFEAMHREGPRHGTPYPLRTVIAGTDPVAVDAVSAAIMGFDPHQVGYIRYAEAAGLGVADLEKITILGDPIARVRRRLVPHSNHAIQRHWVSLPRAGIPAPHIPPIRAERTIAR